MSPRSHQTVPSRRRPLILALLTIVVAVASVFFWTITRNGDDPGALRLLRSQDPASRKLGAWLAAGDHIPEALRYIAMQLHDRREPDANVRESYVYALGRSGDPALLNLVAAAAASDASAYVRQAAWLAAARLDPQRFQVLASRPADHDEPWDQIGRACAWLETGDIRGVDELLRWAVDGTPQQRPVAARALSRSLAPLLDAAGRWPIQFTIEEGQPWPAPLVNEIRQRCQELDLQTIADDTRPHVAHAAPARRNVVRLTHTRARLARLLFRS